MTRRRSPTPTGDRPPEWDLVVLDGTRVTLGGEQAGLRAREIDVLAALSFATGPVSLADLAEAVWLVPPPTAAKTLQNHVARVRRALGDGAVRTEGSSYRLGPGWSSDVARFEEHVADADRAALAGDQDARRAHLSLALGLVRRPPLQAVEPTPLFARARGRLTSGIADAREAHLLATIGCGMTADAVRIGTELVSDTPDRERAWLALAVALARAGERRSAIATLQRARHHLREVAGLSVGHALHRLETLLLADDRTVASTDVETLIDANQRIPAFETASGQFFVGRSAALAQAGAMLASARRLHHGALVVVTGPEGSGRSAFGRRVALLARTEGWQVAQATCRAAAALPLEPFDDLLAALPGGTRGAGGTGGMSVPDPAAALAAHSARRPVLLVIDEAARLPVASVGVVEQLAALPSPLVVVLIAAGEPTASAEHLHRCVLDGLTVAETAQLCELLTGAAPSPTAAAELHRITGGMPRALRQVLLDAGSERSADGDDGSTDEAGLVARAARGAIGRLGPDARWCIVAIHCDAGGATRSLLRAVLTDLGIDDPPAVVADLIGRGLVEDVDGALAIASPAVGDLVAHLDVDRRRVHEAWNRVLVAAGAAPHRRVAHAIALASTDPDGALAIVDQAAAAATAAGSFAEAAALQAAAIELAVARHGRTHPSVLRRRIERGDSLRFAGDDRGPDELWDVVADALACAEHTEAARAAGVLCSLGPSTLSGRVDRPIAELVEACLPRCTDATVLARASAQASLFYSMADYERSRHHYGVALREARRTGDDATLAYVLGFAYTALTDPDDWDLRHRLATELFVLAERRDDDIDRMEAVHLLFSTQLQRGDPLVRTTQAAMARLAQGAPDATRRWMSEYLHAALLHLDGRFDRSIDVAERCRAMAPVSASRATATYLVQFIATRFAQGRAAELAATLRAVAAEQPLMLAWRAIEAWPAAVGGDWATVEAACVATDDGRALPRDMGWIGGTFLLARAVAARGDRERAAALRVQLDPHSGRMTWVGHCTFGPVDLALGELALATGDHDGARRHLERGRALCAQLHAPAFDRDLDALAAALGA